MGTVAKSESFWEDPPPPSSSHSHLSHSVVVSLGNMSQSLNANTTTTGHNNSHHHHHHSYERNLNFSTVTVDDSEYGFQKKKSARDPLSHRIIEKRRRDRMNNCLADLARLLPQASLRKGRGRIEKTEIVELAIKHLKHLQSHPCPLGDNCEFSPLANRHQEGCTSTQQSPSSPFSGVPGDAEGQLEISLSSSKSKDQFRLGYQDCLKETMHFLMERKGAVTGDTFFVQLVDYLNRHAEFFIPVTNNGEQIRAYGDQTTSHSHEGLSDAESEEYLTNPRNDDRCESDELPNKMTPRHHKSQRLPERELLTGVNPENFTFDYEGDNNSCSSTPLSVDISDVISYNNAKSKNTPSCIKPPIPSIIGSHSSCGSSIILSSSNGRSSDEGSASVSIPRYKFKSNIKQRFTADLETTPEVGGHWTTSKNYHRHHSRSPQKSNKSRKSECTSSSNNPSTEEVLMGDEQDEDGGGADFAEISEENIDEKPDLTRLGRNEDTGGKMDSKQCRPQPPPEEKWNSLRHHCDSRPSELSLGKLSMTCGQSGLSRLTATSTREGCTREKLLPLEESKSTFGKSRFGHQGGRNDFPKGEYPGKGVPAFALHETGLFYVPLTLDRDFVAPFCIPLESTSSNPPLHPITISVCFLFGPKDAAAPGIRQTPPDMKFSELNGQSGVAGALNLSKLNLSSSMFPYVPVGSICNPPPPLFMNPFNHQPINHSQYQLYRRDLEEQSEFSNSSSNGKYSQFSQHQNLESDDTNSKNCGSPPFSPYEVQNGLLVPYNQLHHKNEATRDPGRYCRKRPMALSSQSSASSSLSNGYHSWGDNNQPTSAIVESAKGERNNRNDESWDTVQDDSRSKEEKSPRTAHDTTGLKPERNVTDAVPKRQRKGNGSKKKS